jgi:LruC domain-containing protein
MKNINTNSKTKRFQKFKQVASLKIHKTIVIKTIVMAIILFFGTINQSVYGQCCNGYPVWTPGMWIGPAGYNCAGGVQYYQIVSYNGRLYTHKGYCSNAGPGHWDFKDIGACTPSSGSINAGAIGSNQTICPGNTPSALTNVTSPSGGSGYSYQWQSSSNNSTWNNIGGASSITYSPGTLTTSTYIRRVVSSSCNTPVNTAPILITVNTANTAGSPSSTPTLSINTALTNITHTTTGATGIANAGTTGANGLPAGVAASLNNNTITIYGTPSAVGIYNYSIPLTGGCGSVNATGTITVNPATPATPGTISGTATQCAGLASQTYSIAAVTNATSYTWTVPTGWSITAGTVTNSITVTVGASGQNGNVTVRATNSGGTSAAQTLAVTASSNNTVGTASSTPTVCINTALTNITHTTTGATGIANAGTIGANGLPAGVAASLNNNTITIFGTPSAAGIYNYSIQLLGGCGSVNATGTITVTATKTVGSPSSTPTLYTNTALTDITIPTTGATGIGTATGLPAGVTAAWALNTITISGTPTADGTFGYSIPLTGDCGNINATGTITVIPNVVAPTAGSSAAILTFVSQTAITFTFTKGNGANRIIVAKSGSASSTNPTNNTSYAANAAYGSGDALDGFVVYNSDGQSATITNLTAGTTYHFSIYEYNTSGATILYSASTKYTTSATTLQPDADNDGVADADDQYPNDQYKAFNNNYPAASFGTLMYEDLWPGKGDYDFNDLVVDYKFNTITNADNNIVEIRFTFVTRAIGGSLHNGFAFQLDGISQEKITSVTGSKASGAPWISLNSNGTEAGQTTSANILVFDDAYKLLPTQAGFSFVNVYPGSPNSGTDTTTILVKFLSDGVAPSGGTLNYSAFNTGLFNPYLIVGQDRGKEIHLADRIPTSKMNLTYFGQYQDRTNPSSGKYFKTADNLPWAINVDSSIPFATEKTDISEAHLKFIDWATSGGTSSTNWFLNQDGNRNNTKLMNR